MTTEEINKSNENPGMDQILKFINTIEKDGYIVTNFKILREQTEKIARGSLEPIKVYENLRVLEAKLGNMEELTIKLRMDVRVFLDKITNIVSRDSHFNLNDTRFKTMLNDIKGKLGILQAVDRVAEAEAFRAETKAAIDALDDNTTLTPEQKMEKAIDLLKKYNGPNVEAIRNAKKVAATQENRFNQNFDANFIDKLGQDFKGVYDYLMMSDLTSETKKTLIDEFNNILKTRNEFKANHNKFLSNTKNYNNALEALGLRRKDNIDISVKKDIKPETTPKINEGVPRFDSKIDIPPLPKPIQIPEDIRKYDDVVVYNGGPGVDRNSNITRGDLEFDKEYKIADVVIKDGITYYKLNNMGDNLYEASLFDAKKVDLNQNQEAKKEENKEMSEDSVTTTVSEQTLPQDNIVDQQQNDIKPATKRGKYVKDQKPANLHMDKLGILFRTVGTIAVISQVIAIPGIGLPLGLYQAASYIYLEYTKYANVKRNLNEPTILQRMGNRAQNTLKNVFRVFNRKVKEKANDPALSPEDRNEVMNEGDISDQVIAEEDQEMVANNEVDNIITDDIDNSVLRVQRMLLDQGLNPNNKEQMINTPNYSKESQTRMGGR